MIFSTGLNKIYESISKSNNKEQLVNSLQEKIVKNPILSYKYDLLETIKERKNSLSKNEAKRFFNKLKEAHNKFLIKNNSVAIFYLEEKKLFEYFNINQKEIVSSKLDIIIGKKNNELNEAIILDFITNPNLKTAKESIMEARVSLKEDYRNILSEKNVSAFERKMQILSKKASILKGKNKTLVENSINVLKSEIYTNFNETCNKAFKLNVLTEKYLHEDETDDVFLSRDIPTKDQGIRGNKSDDDYEDFEADEDPSLKKYVSTINYEYLDGVVIGYPHKFQSEFITINFKMPIYPVVSNLSDGLVQMPKYRKLFLSLKTTFIKQGLLRTGSKILDIADMIWDASIPVNIPAKTFEDAIINQQAYSMDGKFDITIQIAQGASADKYIQVAEKALRLFDAILGDVPGMSQIVTPEEQLELLSNSTTGRKASYSNRENDKYYKDTHGENAYDIYDDFLLGDSEESEMKNTEDKEFYGDSKKKYKSAQNTSSGMDDDQLDKYATNKAKNR